MKKFFTIDWFNKTAHNKDVLGENKQDSFCTPSKLKSYEQKSIEDALVLQKVELNNISSFEKKIFKGIKISDLNSSLECDTANEIVKFCNNNYTLNIATAFEYGLINDINIYYDDYSSRKNNSFRNVDKELNRLHKEYDRTGNEYLLVIIQYLLSIKKDDLRIRIKKILKKIRTLIRIKLAYYKLDYRSCFRRIFHFLFKNMDDTYSENYMLNILFFQNLITCNNINKVKNEQYNKFKRRFSKEYQ